MYSRFRSRWNTIVSFAEKQGFPIIVTICVAIITASAVWRGSSEHDYVTPTPPVNQEISAAQLLQESLRSIATSAPTPTSLPPTWCAPLDQVNVTVPFNANQMVQGNVTGVWRVHPGVDLAANRGAPVHAIANGEVIAHGTDSLLGTWLLISHGEIEVLYAGMVMTEDYIAGDSVDMSDTIGYVGNGPLDEQDLGPHLHLEAMNDGVPLDPLTLWDSN